MSFRARITVLAAGAVAVAVLIASAVVYGIARSELRSAVDASLVDRAQILGDVPVLRVCGPRGETRVFEVPEPELGAPPGYVQVVCPGDGGAVPEAGGKIALPIGERVRAVGEGREEPFFTDAMVQGTHVRVFTVPAGFGAALQIARPLDEIDRVLDRMRLIMLVVALAGIAGAALLGLLVARGALAPVRRLSAATEHVTRTRDLSRRVDAKGADELSRLAGSFNTMLGALDDSLRAQRQLVADASHELRTPLTSLRTNVEVLARATSLSDDEREALLRDVVEQMAELTVLVGDLVDLARGKEESAPPEDVRLDELVEQAVRRAERNTPQVVFRADVDPTLVHGVPGQLERAIGNLLDNAAKWSPPGGEVEVTLRDGELVVRDHGPGIAETDLPHVFDRFYRADAARGTPGSGLGLAIVRQAAERHGGSVSAGTAPDGGAVLRLRLPTINEGSTEFSPQSQDGALP